MIDEKVSISDDGMAAATTNPVHALHLTKPEKAMAAGLRTVAVFESVKGVLALTIGIVLLTLIHRDAQAVAETIVRYSHLNPDRHFLRRFVEIAGTISDARIWFMAALAFLYSSVRFTEAYGLWHARAWAEWFAILSGIVYVPIEIYELAHRPSIFKVIVLALNVLIVAYLIYLRWYSKRHPETAAHLQGKPEPTLNKSSLSHRDTETQR